VLAGPTAAGKTAIAVEVAQHFRTEIISADSRQFYREMEIGTAKPDAALLNAVRHHFISNIGVETLYGAGHFAADALALLDNLFKGHHLVVVAGGSGLYLDALLNGVDDFEDIPLSAREEIFRDYQAQGLQWLQEEVKRHDPVFYGYVDLNNPQRLMRALEVSRFTGTPYSSFLRRKETARSFTPIKILISPARETLYENINKRVDQMMEKGLLEEARALYHLREYNALKTVGYKELFEHFEGKLSLDEAVEKIKQHTRNYAKRQLTWFRNRDEFQSFDPSDVAGIIAFINRMMHG
jgi:tRNA dimethylallyltransferase